MKKYKIIWCFIYDTGFVEQDEFGKEIYRDEIIEANNSQEAIGKFLSMEQFKEIKPEIVDIEIM